MARICIVGDWHQAVVMGACFAARGHAVVGVAGDDGRARALNAAQPPVHEPELPELLADGIAAGRLRYTTSFDEALEGAEYAIIALDTPVADDDSPVLGPVLEAARRIGASLGGDTVVVVTAQVPVGTCERVAALVEAGNGRTGGVAYVPEFLRLGEAVRTFFDADRFIVGSDHDAAAERVARLYEPLGRPVVRMGLRSAEMTKHACNAFLATSISFINEMADVCAAVGADVDAVARGMKLDRRIGAHAFLSAGLGFAGGTLGRDLRALQALGAARDVETRVVDAVVAVNRSRAELVPRQLRRVFGEVAGLTVGILGLTYKAGTSALRRSIALEIVGTLVAQGARVRAFDPLASMEDVPGAPRFERVAGAAEAATGADALVLVTEWEGIERLDFAAIGSRMRRRVFIDTRNRFDAERMAAAGFVYLAVGRGAAAPEELGEAAMLEAAG